MRSRRAGHVVTRPLNCGVIHYVVVTLSAWPSFALSGTRGRVAPTRRSTASRLRKLERHFLDEHARVIPDPQHSDEEDRFVLLGLSVQLRVLVMCHCYREADQVIRIISARSADPTERRQYAEYLP
jgi:uncharacterized DUF497 family protein